MVNGSPGICHQDCANYTGSVLGKWNVLSLNQGKGRGIGGGENDSHSY